MHIVISPQKSPLRTTISVGDPRGASVTYTRGHIDMPTHQERCHPHAHGDLHSVFFTLAISSLRRLICEGSKVREIWLVIGSNFQKVFMSGMLEYVNGDDVRCKRPRPIQRKG